MKSKFTSAFLSANLAMFLLPSVWATCGGGGGGGMGGMAPAGGGMSMPQQVYYVPWKLAAAASADACGRTRSVLVPFVAGGAAEIQPACLSSAVVVCLTMRGDG